MNKKRVVACVVVLSIVLGMSHIKPCSAVSQTADQAISWVQAQVGKGINYDGAYGNQCVDLIMAYCNYLGVGIIKGNAKDYVSAAIPVGWQRIQGAQPRKGDILVYTSGQYGHVAIYESDSVTYHQNWNKNKTVMKLTYAYNNSIQFGSYWGVIRPDFSVSAPPVNQNTARVIQADVSNMTDNGYTYWCQVDDYTAVKSIKCDVKSNSSTDTSTKSFTMSRVPNEGSGMYKVSISYSSFPSAANVFYNTVQIVSNNGQSTSYITICAAKSFVDPQVTASIVGSDENGFSVRCNVDLEEILRSIQVGIYSEEEGSSAIKWFDMDNRTEKNQYEYSVSYNEFSSESTRFICLVNVKAINGNENQSVVTFTKNQDGNTPLPSISPSAEPSSSPSPSPTVTQSPVPTLMPDEPEEDEIVSLSFEKKKYSLSVGDEIYPGVIISPSDVDTSDLIWSSSDEDVATVDEDGRVEGIGVGSATIYAQSINGSVRASTRINVRIASPIIKKVKGKKKGFDANWKAVKGAIQYQLQYSTSKTFDTVKTKTTDKNKLSVSSLKKKKKYYIRVRCVYKVKGVKKYSSWSVVKSVKTK